MPFVVRSPEAAKQAWFKAWVLEGTDDATEAEHGRAFAERGVRSDGGIT